MLRRGSACARALAIGMLVLAGACTRPSSTPAPCGGMALELDSTGVALLLDTCTGAVRRRQPISGPRRALVGRHVAIATLHDLELLDGSLHVVARKRIESIWSLAPLGGRIVATSLTQTRPLILDGHTLEIQGRIPVLGQGAIAAVRGRILGAVGPGTIWSFDGRRVSRTTVPLDMTDAAALGAGTLIVGRSLDATRMRAGHTIVIGLGLAGSKRVELDLGAGEPGPLVVHGGSAYVVSGLCGSGYRVTRISPHGALISSRTVGMIRAGALVNRAIVFAEQRCDGGAPAVLETLDPETLETRRLPDVPIDTPAALLDATSLR